MNYIRIHVNTNINSSFLQHTTNNNADKRIDKLFIILQNIYHNSKYYKYSQYTDSLINDINDRNNLNINDDDASNATTITTVTFSQVIIVKKKKNSY